MKTNKPIFKTLDNSKTFNQRTVGERDSASSNRFKQTSKASVTSKKKKF